MIANADFEPNHRVLDAFVRWLEQGRFDQQHARNWAKLYHADPEAAMCEATFWAVLSDCGVDVEPNADLIGAKQAPDFRCHRNGRAFYVEVTCIRVETATRESGLKSEPQPGEGASPYRHLNDLIFQECVNKTRQCSNLDAPCVLAVGTFHHRGSILGIRKTFMEWLLTGEASIGWEFDPHLGMCVGEPYQVTSFRSAAFTRLSPIAGIESRRQPISALLVGGFGCDPPQVLGLLHPNPVREFPAALLDRIPFCIQRIDLRAARVSSEWIQTPDEWEGA